MGFGVTLNYPDPAGAVIGADSGHPVFNGPYGATGTAFTGGSFCPRHGCGRESHADHPAVAGE